MLKWAHVAYMGEESKQMHVTFCLENLMESYCFGVRCRRSGNIEMDLEKNRL
jgi:hypothetical protein